MTQLVRVVYSVKPSSVQNLLLRLRWKQRFTGDVSLPPRGITGTLHPVLLNLYSCFYLKNGNVVVQQTEIPPYLETKMWFHTRMQVFFFSAVTIPSFSANEKMHSNCMIETDKVKFTFYFKKASTFQCFCFPFSNKSGCLDDTLDCQPDFWTSTHWITFFIQMQSNSWA